LFVKKSVWGYLICVSFWFVEIRSEISLERRRCCHINKRTSGSIGSWKEWGLEHRELASPLLSNGREENSQPQKNNEPTPHSRRNYFCGTLISVWDFNKRYDTPLPSHFHFLPIRQRITTKGLIGPTKTFLSFFFWVSACFCPAGQSGVQTPDKLSAGNLWNLLRDFTVHARCKK